MISQETIDNAVALIGKGYSQYEYFFSKLSSAEWIPHLLEKGFFQDPPSTELRGDKEYWHRWPESQYLKRVAAIDPEAVVMAFQAVRQTDNPFIHSDLVDAALKIPAVHAVKLACIERDWIASTNFLGVFAHDHGKLIAHLAQGGEAKEALEFARVLLDIVPDPRYADAPPEEEYPEGMEFASLPRPTNKLDHWYGDILQEDIPALVTAADLGAIALLADLVEKAIRLSSSDPDSAPPNDYISVWLPSLDDVDEVSRNELKVQLSVALLNAVEQVVAEDSTALQRSLQILEQHKWDVFARIALHTLARHLDTVEESGSQYVLNREYFDRIGLSSEYFSLASLVFPKLSKEEQERVFEWISEGPTWIPDRCEESLRERERYVKSWKCRRFHVFRECLVEKYESEYRALLSEVGPEGTAPFKRPKSTGATWVGPTSPCDAEKLLSMTDQELVEYLKTWVPKEGWRESTPEGLGRVLSSIVEGNGERFSQLAEKFIGLDPTYVRSLFSGLEKSAGNKEKMAWESVLQLATWVTETHGVEPDVEEYDRDRDPGWGWTRKSIASLLDTGFNSRATEIPFDQREDAWRILEVVCEDPEPSPEYEEKYGGSNMSVVDIALNVVRGRAISAAIGYALWVKRHLLESEGETTERWIDIMPEVRSKLDTHLNPEHDSSLAVRSVYGQYFPQLIWLDEEWARRNSGNIFGGDERTALQQSAWDAFMFFCRPGPKFLEILAPAYRCSVARLVHPRDEESHRYDPDSRLAQHLIVYHFWGLLTEQNLDTLLVRFFENADDDLRRQAIGFAGDCARDYVDEDKDAVLERLKALWLRRRAEIENAATTSNFKKELSAFGSWVVSDAFDEDWAIEQLMWSLRISGKSEPDHLVVRKLSEAGETNLASALRCLRALVDGDEEGWAIHSWRKEAEVLITRCLASRDTAVVSEAEQLVHWLGAKGYSDFRRLLLDEGSKDDG